jgi:hypothetical protein
MTRHRAHSARRTARKTRALSSIADQEIVASYLPGMVQLLSLPQGPPGGTSHGERMRAVGAPRPRSSQPLRPPRPAEVTLRDGVPAVVQAEGAAGEVRCCLGPYRARIGFSRPVLRDYYIIELTGGVRCRLFQDLACRAWFVDARYDV